ACARCCGFDSSIQVEDTGESLEVAARAVCDAANGAIAARPRRRLIWVKLFAHNRANSVSTDQHVADIDVAIRQPEADTVAIIAHGHPFLAELQRVRSDSVQESVIQVAAQCDDCGSTQLRAQLSDHASIQPADVDATYRCGPADYGFGDAEFG